VLDLAHEIVPPFNPQNAMKEAAGLLKSYGIHLVRGDKYAAGFVVEAASRCGLTYEYFEKDRSAIYIEALPLFTSGRARLIDNEKLVRQFTTLEQRTSVTGRDGVDHGRDGHDDLCNAAAGALVLASARSTEMNITPEFLNEFLAQTREGPPMWPRSWN
jgi:hypothetical protein